MRIIQAVLSPVLAASLLLAPMQASAGQDPIGESKNTVKHVLLISVDGLTRWICPTTSRLIATPPWRCCPRMESPTRTHQLRLHPIPSPA